MAAKSTTTIALESRFRRYEVQNRQIKRTYHLFQPIFTYKSSAFLWLCSDISMINIPV